MFKSTNGFRKVLLACTLGMVATLAGEPLYRACGYEAIEHFEDARGGASVPLVRMGKAI
jgi:hypothetical protein